MTDANDGGAPGGGVQPQFTFQLAARSDMAVKRFHTMMMAPGTYRISLVRVPGFTAFRYTKLPQRWITEFFAYRPDHLEPRVARSEPFVQGGRWHCADEAFDAFVPKTMTIPGDWPLPVMFCITDSQDRDNEGGLSVLVEKI